MQHMSPEEFRRRRIENYRASRDFTSERKDEEFPRKKIEKEIRQEHEV